MAEHPNGGRTAPADGGGPRPGITARAQRAVPRAAESACLAAVGSDRPYASPEDAKAGLGERLSTWYTDRLFARAAIDRVVGAAFRDVFCLTAPPTPLVAPRIFLRMRSFCPTGWACPARPRSSKGCEPAREPAAAARPQAGPRPAPGRPPRQPARGAAPMDASGLPGGEAPAAASGKGHTAPRNATAGRAVCVCG
ncbi:hypothetical protein [Streptomyces sp. NPDC054765]